MKNKGFTLIELLAVIVILAIIALIATPIILGIINDAKKQSEDRSAELYLDAVRKAIASYQMSHPGVDFSNISECSILPDDSKLSCAGLEDDIPVSISGQAPTSGTIILSSGNVTDGTQITYGEDKTYVYTNGKLALAGRQETTDASCFATTNERVTSFDINYNVCIAAVPQLFANLGSNINSDDTSSLCNNESIWGGLYLEDFLDNPTYSSMFANNGIISNVETETMSGVYITDYTCSDKNVVIPSTINGKNVLGIATGAFMNKGLTGLTLPNTITFIGAGAFNTNQLTSVIVPNSVQKIYFGAFNSNSINNLTLGNSLVVIGSSAFDGNQLTSLTIPNSVTTIGDYAFQYNQLESVTLGNSVTTIGEDAFYKNRISELSLGNSVTIIGDYAFFINQLTSVTIPNSVTTIGESAFKHNKLTDVTIPNSVTTIGMSAFGGNNIETINIGSGITNIGIDAFSGYYCKVTNNSSACFLSPEYITEEYQSGETYGPNALTSVTINKCENDVTVGNSAFGWANGYNAENNLQWKTTGCE